MTDVAGDSMPSGHLLATADLTPALAGAARDLALYDIALDLSAMRADRVSGLIEAGFFVPTEAARGWSVRMSIQDRQIALFQLAFLLGSWPAWFGATCGTCAAPVDLRVAVGEFEVTRAPEPVPTKVNVHGPSGSLWFRVPTGVDERQIESDPRLGLTEICASATLPCEEVAEWEIAFDAVLSAVLPGLKSELHFDCPECNARSGWWFDPMDWIARHSSQSLADVDALARTYGWSEAAILALPEPRHRQYLAMIGARG